MGKDLLQYKGMKRILAVLTVLTCMQGAAIIMQAEWLAEAVTRLFNGERVGSLFPLLILFTAAFLFRHAVTLVRQKLIFDYAAETGAGMRKKFLEKLFQSGPRLARKEGTGHVVTLRDGRNCTVPPLFGAVFAENGQHGRYTAGGCLLCLF